MTASPRLRLAITLVSLLAAPACTPGPLAPVGGASVGMGGMLLATLAFGWMASAALPDWFSGNFGLLLTPTAVSYAVTVAIMAVSTLAAWVGVGRGLSSRRAGSSSPAL